MILWRISVDIHLLLNTFKYLLFLYKHLILSLNKLIIKIMKIFFKLLMIIIQLKIQIIINCYINLIQRIDYSIMKLLLLIKSN